MEGLEGVVQLVSGMEFLATSENGHTMTLDAAPAVGGQNRGPRPMELLLLGLGGCTGMDVISMLRKMNQEVSSYRVRLHAEQAEAHPRVFTRIEVEHVVRGRNLRQSAIHRAVELSATRYCAAAAMLGQTAEIGECYRIIDEDSGAETVGRLAQPAGRGPSSPPAP